MEGLCHKCKGITLAVYGLVLIVNQYVMRWDPWLVLGTLLVLGGVMSLIKPTCPCNDGMMAKSSAKMPASKKK